MTCDTVVWKECRACEKPQQTLIAIVASALSLPVLVKYMVKSKRSWQSVLAFCETVMRQKEETERLREPDLSAVPANVNFLPP
ncbi:unnamed protein product [Euphydryas editha]|uniref:Uncharacterized protein n=1 Tax=Euphydryas editha TaxID=104508 RepID=A0AAU9TZQ5_EUPED|nr:unnamed protein product [Euphydryas editha]